MLYLDISTHTITAIQVKKSLIGKETILSCARKALSPGLIKNGVITDETGFIGEVAEMLATSYPRAIRDQKVSVSVSDEGILLQRFSLPQGTAASEVPNLIVGEATKIFNHDPAAYENFFKVIGRVPSEKTVLYTALPIDRIVAVHKVLERMGMTSMFLCTQSFALHHLFAPMIGQDQHAVIALISKHDIFYVFCDGNGPVAVSTVAKANKSFAVLTNHALKTMEEHAHVTPAKIIVGGEGSLELLHDEMKLSESGTVIKMSDVFEELLSHYGIKIETGGISPILFALPVGLMVLRHDISAPNFVRDIAVLEKESVSLRAEPDAPTPTPKVQPTDLFIEEKKKRLPLILIIGIVGVVALITGGYLMISGPSIPLLSSFASPTVTPTPTVLPTVTPTPTINPSLKRSDVTVEVRNGTGTTGYAKEIASFLTDKGYTGIKAANADRDDYDKTVVSVKEDKKDYTQLLIRDMAEKFPNVAQEQPKEDQSSDILIILGKQ